MSSSSVPSLLLTRDPDLNGFLPSSYLERFWRIEQATVHAYMNTVKFILFTNALMQFVNICTGYKPHTSIMYSR